MRTCPGGWVGGGPATSDHNFAAVSVIDPLGNLSVASDNGEVAVLAPAIALTKTMSDTLAPGRLAGDVRVRRHECGPEPVSAHEVFVMPHG